MTHGTQVTTKVNCSQQETLATTVSVSFVRADDGNTIVTLVHSGWEARGDQAEDTRANYVTGWTDILQNRFTDFTNAL